MPAPILTPPIQVGSKCGLHATTAKVVAVKDLKTVAADIDDPYAEVAADVRNSHILTNPDFLYLNLESLITGTGAITQAALVRCFGFYPGFTFSNDSNGQDTADPSVYVANEVASPQQMCAGQPKEMMWGRWAPLYDPRTGAHELTVLPAGGTPAFEIDHTTTTPAVRHRSYCGNVYVACNGCSHVVVLPSQAATNSGTITRACLMAWFTGR